MGTVWLCTDEILGRQVAVKQVGTLPGESTLDLARAIREARSSAALNHPNVVSVFDVVEEGDHIWLVMEYIPGRSLSEILQHEGSISPERAAHIGAQVADGLAAAHARGTVHRDVKPGNILVRDDGVAKISDFGIARTVGDPQVTHTGLVTGTPGYFAPELARGGDPTPAADVWALGASLFAAVEGHTLYPLHLNPIALLGEIASTRPPHPERAGFLAEPIVRMLDVDPRSRWTMADVAHVLRRLERQHAAGRTRAATSAFASSEPEDTASLSALLDGPSGAEDYLAATDAGGSTGHGSARRLFIIGFVALLALAATAGVLLMRDILGGSSPDQNARSTHPSPAVSHHTHRSAVATTPGTASAGTPTSSATPTTGKVAGGKAEQFVAQYYSSLPRDTATAWSQLSPSFQSRVGNYDQYRGFWDTISSVAVTDIKRAPGGAVDVSLTYVSTSGSSESEVRRIYVEPGGDSYLITGDQVIG
jgi:serine/threonine protein kinase